MDVCEQALCLASVETTLCDRLVSVARLFFGHDFCLVLDGGEMCVKLWKSGGGGGGGGRKGGERGGL